MKIDFSQPIVDIEGTIMPLKVNAKGEREGVATLREICLNALLASYEDERNLAATEKLDRWTLAKNIKVEDVIDLKTEEVVKLKTLINKLYANPIIVGASYELLEKVEEKKEKK